MSVQEIEAAIAQLSAHDLTELVEWLREYTARVWDNQMERDLHAGRFDALLDEVDKDYQAGLARPL